MSSALVKKLIPWANTFSPLLDSLSAKFVKWGGWTFSHPPESCWVPFHRILLRTWSLGCFIWCHPELHYLHDLWFPNAACIIFLTVPFSHTYMGRAIWPVATWKKSLVADKRMCWYRSCVTHMLHTANVKKSVCKDTVTDIQFINNLCPDKACTVNPVKTTCRTVVMLKWRVYCIL